MISNNKTVVVKVGTSTLTYADGRLNVKAIKHMVKELSYLYDQGYKVILVSSGAVGAGIGKLNLINRPRDLVAKRAVAAIGQVELIHLYESLFFAFDITIAQLLLTKDDFSDRQRYLNARSMVHHLLDMGVIPIVNENDSVVVDEIKVGDNDSLSAFVAALVDADRLVILSDIEGLYDRDPKRYESSKLIKRVDKLTKKIFDAAGLSSTGLGTGGMKTKLIAAKMCMENGTDMVICNGSIEQNLIKAVTSDGIGTLFVGDRATITARKYWLKYATNSHGTVNIDEGAFKAIKNGNSLLPVGIKDIDGNFDRGSVVQLFFNSMQIGVGITNYSSDEVKIIQGKHSKDIEEALGYSYEKFLIHADNLVLEEVINQNE